MCTTEKEENKESEKERTEKEMIKSKLSITMYIWDTPWAWPCNNVNRQTSIVAKCHKLYMLTLAPRQHNKATHRLDTCRILCRLRSNAGANPRHVWPLYYSQTKYLYFIIYKSKSLNHWLLQSLITATSRALVARVTTRAQLKRNFFIFLFSFFLHVIYINCDVWILL